METWMWIVGGLALVVIVLLLVAGKGASSNASASRPQPATKKKKRPVVPASASDPASDTGSETFLTAEGRKEPVFDPSLNSGGTRERATRQGQSPRGSNQKTPQLNRLHALLAEASSQGLQGQTRKEADRFYESVFGHVPVHSGNPEIQNREQGREQASEPVLNGAEPRAQPEDWGSDLLAALAQSHSSGSAPKGPRPQVWALEAGAEAFAALPQDEMGGPSTGEKPRRGLAGGDWWESRDPRFDQRQDDVRPAQRKVWTVLVVDDSKVAREKVRKLLVQMGAQVREAKDGQDAWEQLEQWVPDLVISDIEMPHMDGVVLARKIKSNLRLGSIPVMLMTAHLNTRLQDVAQANIDGFLPKPFSDESLREQATFLLARPRQEAA